MGSPSKYTETQRAEIIRLSEAGLSGSEIAEHCAAGTAACDPFQISKRTANHIVQRHRELHGTGPPRSFADAEDRDALERYPLRVIAVVQADISRLETKATPITSGDFDRMRKGLALVDAARKQLAVASSARFGSAPNGEDALDRIARDLAARERETVPEPADEDLADVAEAEPASEPEPNPLHFLNDDDMTTEQKQQRMRAYLDSQVEANGDDG